VGVWLITCWHIGICTSKNFLKIAIGIQNEEQVWSYSRDAMDSCVEIQKWFRCLMTTFLFRSPIPGYRSCVAKFSIFSPRIKLVSSLQTRGMDGRCTVPVDMNNRRKITDSKFLAATPVWISQPCSGNHIYSTSLRKRIGQLWLKKGGELSACWAEKTIHDIIDYVGFPMVIPVLWGTQNSTGPMKLLQTVRKKTPWRTRVQEVETSWGWANWFVSWSGLRRKS